MWKVKSFCKLRPNDVLLVRRGDTRAVVLVKEVDHRAAVVSDVQTGTRALLSKGLVGPGSTATLYLIAAGAPCDTVH